LLDAVECGLSVYWLDDAVIEFLSPSRNFLRPCRFHVFERLLIKTGQQVVC
jgi:hypothetical protein